MDPYFIKQLSKAVYLIDVLIGDGDISHRSKVVFFLELYHSSKNRYALVKTVNLPNPIMCFFKPIQGNIDSQLAFGMDSLDQIEYSLIHGAISGNRKEP